MLSAGCTLNIYWTDYVVQGEMHVAEHSGAKREPIPLELKPARDAAICDCPPLFKPSVINP
jgi:hypothetical protein